MPDPVDTGTKSPAGVPPAGTGAAVGTTPPAAGPPPAGDLEFVEDQVVEQDGKKMVPLEALLGEREKRRRLEKSAAPPPPYVPQEPEPSPQEPSTPLFNWEKLVPQGGGAAQPSTQQPVGAQGPPPVTPEQFEDNFRDMVNDKPWQAIMWAVQTGMQYRDKMESQARQFVPDYQNLPVYEVSDAEVQALASNPYAMKAMIAKARGQKQSQSGGAQQQQPSNRPAAPSPNPTTPTPEAVKAAMDLILSMGRTSGVSGEGTGGPTSPAPPAETLELDKDSVTYFKARGYTDDQIKEQAKKIVELRKKRGQVA